MSTEPICFKLCFVLCLTAKSGFLYTLNWYWDSSTREPGGGSFS
jgi:hypothetical protein